MTASKKSPCILIVDDEPDICELLEITFQRMHLHTHSASCVSEAKKALARHTFHVCLTDMRLPDGDGIGLVEYIQQQHPQLPVAVITAYGSVDTAVQALKAGAFDFISKPVELTLLRDLISRALSLSQTEAVKSETDISSAQQLLGTSQPMQDLKAMIVKLARSQAPICIFGESGCGKERVAREIHRLGPRSTQPFVPVNCGAIPTELMESEFFGHSKGSFTGALHDKQGLFQAANGGTLFLDEIAELPQHMQVKLLRAIQERAIKAIGAAVETPVDVRILSATHKDLANLVIQGRFRQDLYYRINVIELQVPPLRKRMEDLPALALHILTKIAARSQDSVRSLTPDALANLQAYSYPGNVRELENILERAVALCEGEQIETSDLQLPDSQTLTQERVALLDVQFDKLERQIITQMLEHTGGDKILAAKLLGLTPRQLRYRLHRMEGSST